MPPRDDPAAPRAGQGDGSTGSVPTNPAEQLLVLGIGGSLRAGSLSYKALEYSVGLLRPLGVRAEVFDLRAKVLPFCNGDKEDTYPGFPAVHELRESVRRAHALILATPEYHGGISGVLKNVLDLLDFEHLDGKVIGGISVLGGAHNSNALNELRRIARWCHAWMIPEQVAIGRARQVVIDGQIRDPDIADRLRSFTESLVLNSLRLNDYFMWPPARAGGPSACPALAAGPQHVADLAHHGRM
jgi:FMN reductase